MTEGLSLLAALMVGLTGSTHCLAMCGGLSAALGAGSQGSRLLLSLYCNLGRLLTYTLLGLALGTLGAGLGRHVPGATVALQTLAGLLLIAMGLYLGRWWLILTRIESAGARLWRHLQPLTARLLPIRSPPRALGFGLLWGLLPCGLVYSALAWSLAAGSPWHSALLMATFGLGTLPAMWATTLGGRWLRDLARRRAWQHIAGSALILFGAWQLSLPWLDPGDHGSHHPGVNVPMEPQHHH